MEFTTTFFNLFLYSELNRYVYRIIIILKWRVKTTNPRVNLESYFYSFSPFSFLFEDA